jgi:hypothetical protein
MIEKIGEADYKLNLPSSLTIHLVFHVSQTKEECGEQNGA